MFDRYGFSSPFGKSYGGTQPWFRIGNLNVTTTVAVVGAGIIWMFVWAIEGPRHRLSEQLMLVSEEAPRTGSVPEGQLWRLFTWPIVNEPEIWSIILFAIFYMLGNQLEALMGRRPFLWFLGLLTVVPAVVLSLFEVIFPEFFGFAFGLRFVELGVLVAFAAQYPTARFWPGIPAWGIAGLIIGLDFLQAIGSRNDYQLTMLFTIVAVGLIGIRSFGFANTAQWIPKIPLPASVSGNPSASPPISKQQRRRKRQRTRGRGDLSAVPKTGYPSEIADQEIDALLDQVAEKGLNSLTKDQRTKLENHAKRLRKRGKK